MGFESILGGIHYSCITVVMVVRETMYRYSELLQGRAEYKYIHYKTGMLSYVHSLKHKVINN